MNRKSNTIDRISILLLGGLMNGNKEAVSNSVLAQMAEIENINMPGKDGRTLLIHFCAYDYYYLAEAAIYRKADVDYQDKNGFTALHAAVKSHDIALVDLLLENGASPNLTNAYGNNPSMDATNDWEILKTLLDHGCDIKHKNKGNVSPYDVLQLHDDIAERLFEYQGKK